ncbi:MAG: recombinase family protein [Christensenellales bacterium]
MCAKVSNIPSKPKRGQKVSDGVGVIYARYSSHSQKDISIEQQVALDEELAAEHGIQIIKVYADRAVSGKSDQRPQFQMMMRDARAGMFKYVIAWKSSRIGRNLLEALMNEQTLAELGIRILYVEEDFDDTAAGRFAARSMMNVNQFYSENLAEDISRGMASNAEKCLSNGRLPYGFRSRKDLTIEVVEEEAAVVREIFERVANGEKLASIMNDLNLRGLKTKYGRRIWRYQSFDKLLRNEKYRGIYKFGDIRIEGGMPRIVSDELFFKAQEVLKMNSMTKRANKKGVFLLTGKLFCGECNSHMTGSSGTSKTGTTYYYYVCTGRKNGCEKKAVRKDYLEEKVAQTVRELLLDPDTINWISDVVIKYQNSDEYNAELALLTEQKKANETAISNILKAIELGILTPTTRDRLLELENEKNTIDGKLALLRAKEVKIDREHIVAWLMNFQNGNIRHKVTQEKIINTFVLAVYVYDDGRIKIVFDPTSPCGKKEITVTDDALIVDEQALSVRVDYAMLHQKSKKP